MLLSCSSDWTQEWIKLAQLRLFLSHLLVDIGKNREGGARASSDVLNRKISCLQLLPFQAMEKETPVLGAVSCLWKRGKIMLVLETYAYFIDIYSENEHCQHFIIWDHNNFLLSVFIQCYHPGRHVCTPTAGLTSCKYNKWLVGSFKLLLHKNWGWCIHKINSSWLGEWVVFFKHF